MNDGGKVKLRDLRGMHVTGWAWTVATFCGAGFMHPGPGTWGSVAAAVIYGALVALLRPAPAALLIATLAALAVTVAAGIPAATLAARESGSEDPGFVVIDEVAGMWIALLPTAAHPTWKSVLAALIFFRLFDIWKPFPVHQLEKLPEGWGIVCDDLAAGLYAGICVLILMHWIR